MVKTKNSCKEIKIRIEKDINSICYTHLLDKPVKEDNTNSRKSTMQAIIISFIIVIFSTIRIKFELEKNVDVR